MRKQKLTIDTLVDEFIDDKMQRKLVSNATLDTYTYLVNRYVKETLATTLEEFLDVSRYIDWVNSLKMGPIGTHTYKRRYRAIVSFAVRNNFSGVTPATDLQLLILGKLKYPMAMPYSREEVDLLLEAVKTSYQPFRDQAMVYTLLGTGIRPSEICNLAIPHIDRKHMEMFVNGKTGERLVPVSLKVLRRIDRYIDRERSPKDPLDKHLFLASGKPITTSWLSRHTRRLCIRAGLPRTKDRSAVCFRHTFAIEFIRNGGDIATLSRIMGHSDIKMTQSYLRFIGKDLQSAYQKFNPVDNWL